ncbi:MAG TPA: tetratricopeptide repeat protein [Methylomirabilota bacterium]|nr:tetratricopeptide repeat protein [Methylomirabilota bacterium]
MTIGTDKFSRLAALKPARAFPQRQPDLRTPNEDDPVSRLLGGGIARNHYGDHLAIRNWFSTPEFASPSPVALDLLAQSRDISLTRRTRTALEDPEKWLFLDIETTGLAGGTGTYAFLVGLAWWDAGGLQVEQLFLRDFSEEHSLLYELAARLAERPVLVTFNGKSFDWPLLENRFTMTRAIRIPQLTAHLDLLHPARALWRLRLGSVRLVELERHVLDTPRLGWHREDDVASALIPQYYFDYLRGASPQPLAGVVKHNQMDLRGLAALFGKINHVLESASGGASTFESLDLFGLSKFLQRRGKKDWAHSACSQALDLGLPAEFRSQATRELAQMARQCGEVERAAALWHELVSHPQDAALACEQLAIHYERREKNLTRALEFAELGLKKIQLQLARFRDPYTSARAMRQEQKLVCRRERLRHRIAKDQAATRAPLLAHSAAASGSRQRSR